MSYDLNLWTTDQVPAAAIKELLPKAEIRDRCVQLEGDGWLVTIENSVAVESEDIPDAVMAAWPGIVWLSSVNIEPIHGPGAVKREVKRVLKALARDFHGAVEDPQTDKVALPSGTKQLPAAAACTRRQGVDPEPELLVHGIATIHAARTRAAR